MTTATHDQPQTGIDRTALLAWLRVKLAEANHGLVAREQAAETWRGGDEEAWEETAPRGTKPPNKAERLQIAATETRIAGKYRRDIEAIQRLIEIVGGQS